jgi:hypothetical protein
VEQVVVVPAAGDGLHQDGRIGGDTDHAQLYPAPQFAGIDHPAAQVVTPDRLTLLIELLDDVFHPRTPAGGREIRWFLRLLGAAGAGPALAASPAG